MKQQLVFRRLFYIWLYNASFLFTPPVLIDFYLLLLIKFPISEWSTEITDKGVKQHEYSR